MAHYSLDELLEEVNKVALKPSAETLRSSVTKDLIHVYRRIGSEALFHPGVLNIAPTDYQYVDLPETMIRLIDVKVGHSGVDDMGVTRIINRFGKMVAGQSFTAYTEQEKRLWFDEGSLRTPLTATYWSVPVNRKGAPLVDDRIWKAAVLYCQSEVARVNLHAKNKQSYSAVPMQVDQQLAAREMDAARADCNELADPDFVKLYDALAMQNENTFIRIGY